MTDIQKKALEHVKKLLSEYNTYHTYRYLEVSFLEVGAKGDDLREKLKGYEIYINEEYKKVKEAKDWVESLLKTE